MAGDNQTDYEAIGPTMSAYEDVMTTQIREQYGDVPPVYGEQVQFMVDDPSMLKMITELRHAYYDSSVRAAQTAVLRMYQDIFARKYHPDDQKACNQFVAKLRIAGDIPQEDITDEMRASSVESRVGRSWSRWEDAMRQAMPDPHIVISPELVPFTILHDVSVFNNGDDLFCTHVSVTGVDDQQLVVSAVKTTEAGWMPVEEYTGSKEQGDIEDEVKADVQTILGEEISDTARPGTVRRLPIRVRVPHIGVYKHGDRLRVYGYYKEDEKDRRKHLKNAYIDARHVELLPAEQDTRLTDSELSEISGFARREPEKYMEKLVASVAPHIVGNTSQKMLVMMTVVKGSIHGSSRDNLHMLMMDSPGSGKSDLLKWLAGAVPGACYIDAPNATAQGLLYGQEEFNGRKILHAGVMLRYRIILIDEMDKMSKAEREKVYSAIEQQMATYNKVPFHGISTNLDIGMIAAANPDGGKWIEGRLLSDNTKSLEPPLISRCVLTRMDKMDNVDRLVDVLTADGDSDESGNDSLYTKAQIAGIINHCTKLRPRYTKEGKKAISDYLKQFRSIRESQYADMDIDTRKEIDVARMSSAAAKIMFSSVVDGAAVKLGVRIYHDCLQSIGMNTETPTVEMKLAAEPKDILFWELFSHLANEEGLVRRVELIKEMTDTGKWKNDNAAELYLTKVKDKHSMIFEPRSGWYQKVGGL